MKYIIKESSAKMMSFKDIDEKVKNYLDRGSHDTFITYSQKIDFELGDFDEIIIEYDSSDGRLYVDTTFFGPSLTMFGYGSKERRKELFSDWFEYYEGIKPNFVDVTI